MAIVYQGQNISVFRNGQPYAAYTTSGEPYAFGLNTAILFGPRHLLPNVAHFAGRIRDARVYAQPLDQAAIAAMRPGEPVAGHRTVGLVGFCAAPGPTTEPDDSTE